MRLFHTDEVPFTQIANKLLEDARLTYKAKGVLAYLLSKPPGWQVQVSDIMKHGRGGEAAVRSALRELRRFNYARLENIRENGRIRDRRLSISWKGDLASDKLLNRKNLNEESRDLSNKESSNTELKLAVGAEPNKKHILPRAEQLACERVWQAYPKRAGKPAALRAIKSAIKREGFDKIMRLTQAFAKARPDKDDPFTPWPQKWFNQARYNDDPSTWLPRGRDGKPAELSAARKLWLKLHPEKEKG